MKTIERNEILGLAEYEGIRERFRSRVIDEKKRRRVQLGPKLTALFENRNTILLQIQEMLRTERITRPDAVQHEIDTYSENLPGNDELSCTVMIEIPDAADRDVFLRAASGIEDCIWLASDVERVAARSPRRPGASAGRTTAVHYVKFSLPGAFAEALREVRHGAAPPAVVLEVDHPAYAVRAILPPITVLELVADLWTP